MPELADTLLEAHVQHELSRWRGAFVEEVTTWTDDLFRWFGDTKLDDVADTAQVMGVIDRYVIQMRLSGGVTELVGEMSQVVFHSKNSAATRLNEVLDEVHYERFAEKVTALEGVRRELISIVARSEAFELASARLLARGLSDLMLGAVSANRVAARLAPAIERRLRGALAGYLQRRRDRGVSGSEQRLLDTLDPECVRSLADEIWASVASLPLTDAFLLISEQDLEDFVALGYEFWQRYRKTDYFRRISEEVVAHFFAKYGQQSLALLIGDMGVTQEMVAEELATVLGPFVAEAAQSGFLEEQVRARLARFYHSPGVAELISRA